MTKKIDRSRIDAGKVELPKRLTFLTTEKLDFLCVIDRAGEYSVELPAASLAKLVKGRTDLTQLKAEQRAAAKTQGFELAAEKASHDETRAALAKAERKIQSLTKAAQRASAPTGPEASVAAPAKPRKATAKKAAPSQAEAPGQIEGSSPAEPAALNEPATAEALTG